METRGCVERLKDGSAYLSVLYGLIDAGAILVLSPNERLMEKAYMIAGRHRISVYDSVFVSLALELAVGLKSFDGTQMRVMKSEFSRS